MSTPRGRRATPRAGDGSKVDLELSPRLAGAETGHVSRRPVTTPRTPLSVMTPPPGMSSTTTFSPTFRSPMSSGGGRRLHFTPETKDGPRSQQPAISKSATHVTHSSRLPFTDRRKSTTDVPVRMDESQFSGLMNDLAIKVAQKTTEIDDNEGLRAFLATGLNINQLLENAKMNKLLLEKNLLEALFHSIEGQLNFIESFLSKKMSAEDKAPLDDAAEVAETLDESRIFRSEEDGLIESEGEELIESEVAASASASAAPVTPKPKHRKHSSSALFSNIKFAIDFGKLEGSHWRRSHDATPLTPAHLQIKLKDIEAGVARLYHEITLQDFATNPRLLERLANRSLFEEYFSAFATDMREPTTSDTKAYLETIRDKLTALKTSVESTFEDVRSQVEAMSSEYGHVVGTLCYMLQTQRGPDAKALQRLAKLQIDSMTSDFTWDVGTLVTQIEVPYDVVDEDGNTFLHIAAANNSKKCVELLLGKRGKLENPLTGETIPLSQLLFLKNNYNKTAFSLALENSEFNVSIAAMLIQAQLEIWPKCAPDALVTRNPINQLMDIRFSINIAELIRGIDYKDLHIFIEALLYKFEHTKKVDEIEKVKILLRQVIRELSIDRGRLFLLVVILSENIIAKEQPSYGSLFCCCQFPKTAALKELVNRIGKGGTGATLEEFLSELIRLSDPKNSSPEVVELICKYFAHESSDSVKSLLQGFLAKHRVATSCCAWGGASSTPLLANGPRVNYSGAAKAGLS